MLNNCLSLISLSDNNFRINFTGNALKNMFLKLKIEKEDLKINTEIEKSINEINNNNI